MTRYLLGLILLVLTIAFLAWRLDLREALRLLGDVEPLWFLVALPTFGLSKLLHAMRWRLLLPGRVAPPAAPMLAIFLVSNLVNAILPLRAGDATRVQLTAARYHIPRAELATSVVVVETLLDGVAFAVILIAALALGAAGVEPAFVAVFVGLVVAATASGVLIARNAWFGGWLGTYSDRMRAGLALFATRRALVVACVPSLAGWLLEAVAYRLLGEAFGLDLEAESYLLIAVAANLITAVPLTPFGFGIYELGLQELVAELGAGREEALAYALGSHILLQAWVAVAGVGAALALRIDLTEIFYLRRPERKGRPGE